MFKGIEGLRGYLAWSVVAVHLIAITGLPSAVSPMAQLIPIGKYSVEVFIIISGFVITNLVIVKNESFGIFLARRALRIYPAYLVALVLGIALNDIAYEALAEYPPLAGYIHSDFTAQQFQFENHFLAHLVAHLTLLQGLIPNSILNRSQYMFVAPAWSLSLEWQFYLIAPFAIAIFRRSPLTLTVIATVGLIVYHLFFDNMFDSPSFILGEAHLFLLGITTRIYCERLPSFKRYPWAIPLGCVTLLAYTLDLAPLVIWVAIVCYMRQQRRWKALEGRAATYAGLISYPVYLIHEPIYKFWAWIAIVRLNLGFWTAGALITIGTIAVTAAGGMLLHHLIEAPAIRLGKRLGNFRPASDGRAEAANGSP